MPSWIFSIITPVFSVTWSFRNHSDMLICCSRNMIPDSLIINVLMSYLINLMHPCWINHINLLKKWNLTDSKLLNSSFHLRLLENLWKHVHVLMFHPKIILFHHEIHLFIFLHFTEQSVYLIFITGRWWFLWTWEDIPFRVSQPCQRRVCQIWSKDQVSQK